MTQAKITSIYNNKPSNPNISSCQDSNANLNFTENMDIDTENRNYHNGTSTEHYVVSHTLTRILSVAKFIQFTPA